MSGFSPEWLSLREPYDLAARNPGVIEALARAFIDRPAMRVVDLACGTGATVRAVAAHLPMPQHWRLVDNDLGLLARAARPFPPPLAGEESRLAHPPPLAGEESRLSHPPPLAGEGRGGGVNVVTRPVDLVRDLELALEAPLDLVTTSALLDLVSPEWLDRLIIEAAARRLPVYAALTYDGRVALEPAGEFDAQVLAAFNLHQRTDKGFGPALGPAAAARAVERLEHFGFVVEQGHSDWVLGPADHAMQEALLAGWAEVAAMTLSTAEMARWLAARRSDVAAGRLHLHIGHRDVFARPIGSR